MKGKVLENLYKHTLWFPKEGFGNNVFSGYEVKQSGFEASIISHIPIGSLKLSCSDYFIVYVELISFHFFNEWNALQVIFKIMCLHIDFMYSCMLIKEQRKNLNIVKLDIF